MRSYEHRAIGDEATGGALVNLGGEALDERFLLTFGDVVALSGDYFRPEGHEERGRPMPCSAWPPPRAPVRSSSARSRS